jgi:hypothetical protein
VLVDHGLLLSPRSPPERAVPIVGKAAQRALTSENTHLTGSW